mmetsp:Transcript_23296/g.38970  ORF Transcript_23296/g.38970 Transcript_23296/m.38970 type:complete len:249 (-) Transcript_23296:17-763(-)
MLRSAVDSTPWVPLAKCAIIPHTNTHTTAPQPPALPPSKSRVAMYATLLFYTVGVFAVSYVLGGQSVTFEDKAHDVAAFQAQAEFYKEQTRSHKLEYGRLSSTPVGTVPSCSECGSCPPQNGCDDTGCPVCPSNLLDATPSDANPWVANHSDANPSSRRLQSFGQPACPPCPPCTGPSGAGRESRTSCEKEAIMRELTDTEGKMRAGGKREEAAQLKHAELVECLKTVMPATGEAYERHLRVRDGKET